MIVNYNESYRLNELISEINQQGRALKFIKDWQSVETMDEIEINRVIARVEASMQSDSHLNLPTVSLTIILTVGATVMTSSPGKMTIMDKFTLGTAVIGISFMIMRFGLWIRSEVREKSYFKDLLHIYLNFKKNK
ncbi:hypothetical protein [Halobacillus salinus]|uniref:hypothetical protein n=1 Tax=Halobacillus salinus TaxID=192814 RepID=UPI0009A89E52|nr:hypothetical protein [Halobacillus salinus]